MNHHIDDKLYQNREVNDSENDSKRVSSMEKDTYK